MFNVRLAGDYLYGKWLFTMDDQRCLPWTKQQLKNNKSSKMYDKREDFDFDKTEFPFLDDDIVRSISHVESSSQTKQPSA